VSSPAIVITDPRNGRHFRISANDVLQVEPQIDGAAVINVRGVGRVYAAERASEVVARTQGTLRSCPAK
jgi:hypothetical protein